MQALRIRQYGAVDSHAIETTKPATPGTGEVLIRNHAAGLNFPDALMLMGKYQKRPEPPFTPGRDCAGEIYAIGQHVEKFKIGDRVVAQVFTGAFAELVLAPVSRVFSLPEKVSYEDAAGAVTVFNTAYTTCVQRADVKPTETVLITGAAGGVGLACIQLCKQLGATVVAAVSSEDKASLCKKNGADNILIYKGLDGNELKELFRSQVRSVNNGHGANVVIDPLGGDFFTAGLRALAFRGRIVIVGFSSGAISEVRGNYLLYNGLTVMGAPLDINFDLLPTEIRAGTTWWLELLAQKHISANVTETYSFDQIGTALTRLLGRQARGKIVLDMS